MPVTMLSLLAEPRLRLRQVLGPAELPEGALERPISWVHSSDLVDPTPFLDRDHLLLVDGTQFPLEGGPQEFYDAYVGRLVEARVIGLGFATQVVHGELPEQVRLACLRHGLPLLEVPERIPFIAIIQHVAERNAEEQHAGMTWLLESQRAIARAARRPGALGAVLTELERRLDCWVAVYDAAGEPWGRFRRREVPRSIEPVLREQVRIALGHERAGLWRLAEGDLQVTFQTIGRKGAARGLLAIGRSEPMDSASSELIGSVIGFAGIALDQQRGLADAGEELRAAVLVLLLRGEDELARRVARPVWGELPRGEARIVAVRMPPRSAALRVRIGAELGGTEGVFPAFDGEDLLVLCGPEQLDGVLSELDDLGLSAGWGEARMPGGFAAGADRARRAADRAARLGGGAVGFAEVSAPGLLGLIPDDSARRHAEELLAPLLTGAEVDGRGPVLLHTAQVWIAHDFGGNQAAEELGIHRHSLRHRITAIGRALDLDLTTTSGRFQLWSALGALRR